jgi:hypothetical protein
MAGSRPKISLHLSATELLRRVSACTARVVKAHAPLVGGRSALQRASGVAAAAAPGAAMFHSEPAAATVRLRHCARPGSRQSLRAAACGEQSNRACS